MLKIKIINKLIRFVVILLIPYLLYNSKLIRFRNERENRFKYFINILTNNEVLEAIKQINNELIYDISFNNIIKFCFSIIFVIVLLKSLPCVFKIIIKIFKAIIIINNRINALIHIIKRKNVKHIMLCIIKYNILPSSKSPLKMVTLSIELNNKVFYGGLNLNTKYGKLTKLHLISATGLEIEHILPHPLVIIPTRSSVYLCGKFIDENGTPQRKISLTTRATNITIDNQAVRIKGIR